MDSFGPKIETPEIEEDLPEIDIDVDLDEYGDDEEVVEITVTEHGDNLAEVLEDDELATIGLKVKENFEADRDSRVDWAESYVKGLDLLGLRIEERTIPWAGAAGVFHPILMESVIRFQAQAMGEIYPAAGPARTKIVGKATPDTNDRAKRVEREMNYELTENMVEYREELETMLFHLPLAGSAFKKTFYAPTYDRPMSLFVASEDLYVSYGATNMEMAERFTHMMRKTPEEMDELQVSGFYSGEEISPPTNFRTDIQEKYDEINGQKSSYESDQRHVLLEQHCLMRVPTDDPDESGLAQPYVVTIDYESNKVLAIRRNWREDDERKRPRSHFVHYKYLPGPGFYGIGLIHLLGGLTKTATSILRQLIDSGTLSNLPAGFKTRGLRVKGDNTPFKPGEFRDVDVPGTSIRDHITYLPFKEPSTVLYQLLGNVIEEARRIGAVAETELTSLSKDMPVGTAFAILERQMKVMTGVQARLHAAQGKELKILATLIHDHMPETYEWDKNAEFNRKEDFEANVSVIPVSDPNAATTAQRVVSYQAAMEASASAPHLYDMGKLHRQMLDILGIDNAEEILKLPEDIKPMDPVTENMAILKQEPTKAFAYQDHQAHIGVHMAAMEDPKIKQLVGQSPFAAAIQAAMVSHITEHVAMEYRKQIEMHLGVALPDPEETLPEDVELNVSRMAAEAAQKLLGKNMQEMAAQNAEKAQNDPITQMQQREIALKEAELQHKMEMDKARLEQEREKHADNMEEMEARRFSEENRAAANVATKLATTPTRSEKVALEAADIAAKQAKKMEDGLDNDRNGSD